MLTNSALLVTQEGLPALSFTLLTLRVRSNLFSKVEGSVLERLYHNDQTRRKRRRRRKTKNTVLSLAATRPLLHWRSLGKRRMSLHRVEF